MKETTMPPVASCPDLTRYQQLAAGKLAEADEEVLLAHLERCEACGRKLEVLGEPDALVGLLRQGRASGKDTASGPVARLIDRLSKLRPGETSAVARDETSAPRAPAQAQLLTMDCPACRKRIGVKRELSGKKVKCPHCQTVIQVSIAGEGPAQKSAGSPASQVVVGPTVAPDGSVCSKNSAGPQSVQGSGQPQSVRKELYEFLAPAQSPDELGRLGPYRVLRVLGAGGMGVVFLAEDPDLERLVALKAMLPGLAVSSAARQRFLREARAAAALKHDHVVTIHQVGEDSGVPFLAMEFLEGEPLDARIEREGKLPVAEVLRIGREMAEGLAAAHARGLIHRDIKPANVWLEGKKGRVKILDFGLARAASGEGQLTQSGAIVGTPAYMSPEQGQGKPVDQRSDLFSLGCVLYRLATGEAPFRGTDVISTLMAVSTHHPRPPLELDGGLPVELSDLIMSLLAKEPGDRPASAQAVADVLNRLAGEQQVRPAAARASKKPKRRLAAALALAVALLAPLGGWLAVVLLRVETPNGTLLVEMNDDEVEARIKGGKLILSGPDGKVRYTLSPSERKNKIDEGPYTVHVEGADGLVVDTPEFTIRKGRPVTVRVTLERKAAATDSPKGLVDPNLKAAEYVLSISGWVRVDGVERNITAVADLPGEPFRLTWVMLRDNGRVDPDLAAFKGIDCGKLTKLDLWGTGVSDAGLAHFKGCKNLTVLALRNARLTDVGLAWFKDCKNLAELWLSNTPVTNAGLAHFKHCKNLTSLDLESTRVTDEGLAYFTGCKNLTTLVLNRTRVTNEGLTHFKDCKNLTMIGLHSTQVSDAGLAHFKGCKNFTRLHLWGTQVSDAGLTHFKDCKHMADVELRGTKVTAAGVAEMQDRCQSGPARPGSPAPRHDPARSVGPRRRRRCEESPGEPGRGARRGPADPRRGRLGPGVQPGRPLAGLGG
jgi:serine/threonine protein kinase/uncharacterized membrane protein/phage FluMu protein Com